MHAVCQVGCEHTSAVAQERVGLDAATGCELCGDRRELALRDFTLTLTDTAPHCDKCAGREAAVLTAQVLPCAVPTLFCGLVDATSLAQLTGGGSDAETAERGVREAVWALRHSGSRVVFQLEDRAPAVAPVDSQGYGLEVSAVTSGNGLRYAIRGLDWSDPLALDWECGGGCGGGTPAAA